MNPPSKIAGVTMPLFSLRSRSSWGVGEMPDLVAFAAWMKERANISLVQVLPLGEISGGETSPYAALSAFAMDPLYIAPSEVPELRRRERDAIGDDGVAALQAAMRAPRIDYGVVRTLKQRAFAFAFKRFLGDELARGTARAASFLAFVAAEQAWLDDYALFRALKDAHEGVAWWDWVPGARDHDATFLAGARADLALDILQYEYLQWLAAEQWTATRAGVRALGVEIMGDLPFMVGRDSVDVWAHRSEFKLAGSVGAPPDAFSDEGQDWGLPPYDWKAMAKNDYAWLRRRCAHMGRHFDRFRIDHLVGFYRTYQRKEDDKRGVDGRLVPGVFDPPKEADQIVHGAAVVGAMRDAAAGEGAKLIAEDLGVVPDAVRASLKALGVPGYRVLIWEKDGDVFRDPKAYPAASVACFGTHDTAPVAAWWESLAPEERAYVEDLILGRAPPAAAIPAPAKAGDAPAKVAAPPRKSSLPAAFNDEIHAALVKLLAGSSSELVLFMFQDLVGARGRINTPGTTGVDNWTYRLAADIDVARTDPQASRRLETVGKLLSQAGRAPGS